MSDVPGAPLLEVVICTYNNAGMLGEVLTALARQTPVEHLQWSCLVVDNNCTDETQNVVHEHAMSGAIPGLRVVRETKQGWTPARLRGAKSSTAPWIAFVDDDCILRADWIAQAGSFARSHPWIGAFGGRVVLDWAVEPSPYMRAFGYSFAEQDHGDGQKKVPFLAGAGLVVNRSALSVCRWMDGPMLADRTGTALVSGGDVEIVLRISGAEYELWYVPECELVHRIPARRISLGYLIAINRALGISQTLADVLVWEGSDGAWFAASARKLAKDVGTLRTTAVAVARRRRAVGEILIEASFTLGRLLGILRILAMAPSRRRGLMGRARPSPSTGRAEPTRAS